MRFAHSVALGVACLCWIAASAAAQERPRAAGGQAIIETAETAPATVVANVEGSPRQLDRSGWSATLRVEQSLYGPFRPGAEVVIAWEELASSRGPRFADGDRVLVCLEALPGASIWRQRLPDPEKRTRTLGVARKGDAFLRRPRGATGLLLQHYLALGRTGRSGAPGAGYLVDLVAAAEPVVAIDAVGRLRGHQDLDAEIGSDGGGRLVQLLARSDADDPLGAALVALIDDLELESTRPALAALAAVVDPPASPNVFAALARLDGGLGADSTAQLLGRPQGAYREVAVRWARGPEARVTLARLATEDPEPDVRAGALERLAQLGGAEEVEPLARGLSDADGGVRGVAARALAGVGPAAVPTLLRVVDSNDPEAARAAVVGLALSSAPSARAALVEIAGSHPDAGVRDLAGVALGEEIGHRH